MHSCHSVPYYSESVLRYPSAGRRFWGCRTVTCQCPGPSASETCQLMDLSLVSLGSEVAGPRPSQPGTGRASPLCTRVPGP
eukprot:3835577-Rhodomonas_salina.1